MPEIIVTVDKDGSTSVAVSGVSGPGCQEMTAGLQAALGEVTKEQLTMDYFLGSQDQVKLEDKYG